MEGLPAWHGSVRITTEQFKQALHDLGVAPEEMGTYIDGRLWN